MICFLTGSTGFLGKNISNFLTKENINVRLPGRGQLTSELVRFQEIDMFIHVAGKAHSTSTTKEEKQIHLVRYELVKNFLETVLTESNEVDEDLGMKTNEVSIPFKIAFNSLLVKKIINKL